MTGPGTYNGSPWRSRFLRTPKIGLELAARADFAAAGAIAAVSLGAKTGSDAFFFLTKAPGKAATATRVRVTGLGGWQGDIPKDDLLPALRRPKDLDVDVDGRRTRLAAVPRRGDLYYLAVRPNRVDAQVREYVQYGEERGVHHGDLVKSNATDGTWFRQTRARVTSRWALPYNSGYDYSAVDNSVGALLNGRFVGVDPLPGVDAELLGAVLNSTFTTVSRLLEGVATGNEGAFDVGPPSVRVMRIPDPRVILGSTGEGAVRAAWQAILADRALPAAPLGDSTVPVLRARLDAAVLVGLGMGRGDAAVLRDRVYRSYSRWRQAVEGVEDSMQGHRKALAKRGGTRTVNPVVRAARTVHDEMQPTPALLGELAAPDETIELVDPVMPRGPADQGLLFEATIVTGMDGQPLDLGSEDRVALAAYLRGLGMTGLLPLPTAAARCRRILDEAVAASAAHLDEALIRAAAHAEGEQVEKVARAVHAQWQAQSIKAIRDAHTPKDADEPLTGEDADGEEASLFNPTPLVPPPPVTTAS